MFDLTGLRVTTQWRICLLRSVTLAVLVLMVAANVTASVVKIDQFWTFYESIDRMSDEKNVGVVQPSQSQISDSLGVNSVIPEFSIVCTPYRTNRVLLWIDWKRFITTSDTEVTLRVDDKKAMTYRWETDKTSTSTYTRSSAHTDRLINYMTGGKTLLAAVSPYGSSRVIAEFDLSTLDRAIEAVMPICKEMPAK